MIEYNSLMETVDFIIDNYDREIEYINSKCQAFLDQTVEVDGVEPLAIDIDSLIAREYSGDVEPNTMQVAVYRPNQTPRKVKVDVSSWSDGQIDDLFKQIINAAAKEREETYEFDTHKNSRTLELPWKSLSENLKVYKGISMTEWRAKFKEWYGKEKPEQLRIKGLKVI